MSKLVKTSGIILGVLVALAIISLVIWRVFFVTMVDAHELAFSYDRLDGQIEQIKETGWVTRLPIRYAVHTIDMRPYQVTISANQRILNAKLVRFNPEGIDKFVEWHGRDAGDNLQNLLEILKCYAFDKEGGASCPFLTILNEVSPGQAGDKEPASGGKQ